MEDELWGTEDSSDPPAQKKRGRPPRFTAEQLTRLKVAFAVWLTDTDPNKGSQNEWAMRHGISPTSVSIWKNSDPLVLKKLKEAVVSHDASWGGVLANLLSIAQDREHPKTVEAAKEVGKLLKKYPSEKIDMNVVERIAYVEPGALRKLSLEIEEKELVAADVLAQEAAVNSEGGSASQHQSRSGLTPLPGSGKMH